MARLRTKTSGGRKTTVAEAALQQLANSLKSLHDVEPKSPPIRPHPGPQLAFIESRATITVFGGQGGGGKSFALHLKNCLYAHVPGYSSVMFRRISNDLRMSGGLWPRAHEIYPLIGGSAREDRMIYTFPSGATVQHQHMEHEKDRFNHRGGEYCHVAFDEVQDFTEDQFWFLMSRNRSKCGVTPFMSATCNPDPDSFIAKLIEWWIDPDSGFAIPERSGVVRWMVRADDSDTIFWGNTPKEARLSASQGLRGGEALTPMSFTFIHSSLADNPTLLKTDPLYLVKLQNLPRIERERLLGGNWHIRPSAGMIFNRDWFKDRVSEFPKEIAGPMVRGWDLASSSSGGDRTASVKGARGTDGRIYVQPGPAFRESFYTRDEAIRKTAEEDGTGTFIEFEQDPGGAGKEALQSVISKLTGFVVKYSYTGGSNNTRLNKWKPAATQAEAGNIVIVDDGTGLAEDFVNELHNSDGSNRVHDDWTSAFATMIRGLGKAMTRAIW